MVIETEFPIVVNDKHISSTIAFSRAWDNISVFG